MTIILTHPCDGTIGQAVNVTSEGFTKSNGTAATYVAGGVSGQALRFVAGGNNFVQDNYTGTAGYVGTYVRMPSLPSTALTILAGTYNTSPYPTEATVQVNPSGTVSITNGQTTVAATSTMAFAANTWYRVEWQIGSSSQTLRIFSPATASTPTETLTGATQGSPITKYSYGCFGDASNPATDTVDLDTIELADAWPNMGVSTKAGSSSGAVAWSGAASGSTTKAGASSGATSWHGSAAGTTGHTGSASGGVAWQGAVSGSALHGGSTSGQVGWSSAAAGNTQHAASAAGSVEWAGAAAGTAPVVGSHSGSASGALTWSGSASGAVYHSGTGAGSITWIGAAAGHNSSTPARDIDVTASPVTTGWQVMGTTGYPATTGAVNNNNGYSAGVTTVDPWAAAPLINQWSTGPIWIQES